MKNKTLKITLCALFCSYGVLLPQIFHIFSSVAGGVFLPMHIPVLIAGLCLGPGSGAVVGLISPMVSCAVTGMPSPLLLPFMTIELVSYGFFSGLISKKLPIKNKMGKMYVALFLSQILGRTVRAATILFSVYVLSSNAMPIASIWTAVVTGIPGIIIQWIFVPILSVAILKFLRNINVKGPF